MFCDCIFLHFRLIIKDVQTLNWGSSGFTLSDSKLIMTEHRTLIVC